MNLKKGLPPSLLLFLTFLLLISLSCVRNPATRKVHARLLSPEAEKKIGKDTKAKIEKEYKVLESTEVTKYVDKIGQKLAAVSDRPTVDYEFTVLDSDLINAFAAPGGYVFITRGLLENIEDEAELAMVLGHEIAHVAALHGVQIIQKQMGQNALTILGTIGAALVAGPEAMLVVSKTGSLFSSLYLLGYSREKELEADNIGLQYMLRAGYDPQASLRFLKELQKGEDKDLEGWDLYFRTHPATSERIDIIKHMIGQGDKDEKKSFSDEFRKIKALLPKVDEKERGQFEDQTYRNSVHEVTLTVPKNWLLGFFHPQSLISFHTKDQKGHGRLQQVRLSSQTLTAENLATQFSKNAGYKFISGRDVLYKAGYGFLGRYLGVSPRGKLTEYRMFATIRRGKGYILLLGAPPEKVESYFLDMERIMRGLEFG